MRSGYRFVCLLITLAVWLLVVGLPAREDAPAYAYIFWRVINFLVGLVISFQVVWWCAAAARHKRMMAAWEEEGSDGAS